MDYLGVIILMARKYELFFFPFGMEADCRVNKCLDAMIGHLTGLSMDVLSGSFHDDGSLHRPDVLCRRLYHDAWMGRKRRS